MAKIIAKDPASVNEEESVTFIEDRIKEGKNPPLEQQWAVNIAFLTGKQWIVYDKSSQKIVERPKDDWWEERVTINRIRPVVRTELAKITKSKIQFNVIPASNEEEDIDASKVGTQAIDFVWRNTNMDEKRFKSALWQITTGTSIQKTFWNDSLGEEVQLNTLDEHGNFALDEKGNEITQTKRLGDIDNSVVSPFDFVFDPSATEFDNAKWCCERILKTVDEVKDTYDVEVSPEGGLSSTNIFNGILANVNGQQSDFKPISMENGVVVKEYWEKPSKKYPKGRHITIANGKLLQFEDNPYDILPYFLTPHNLVPGRVYGSSNIEDLIPVQREYNKTRTQRRLNQTRTGNPRFLYQINSLIDEPTNEPGEKLGYKKGYNQPNWETPPSEPGHIQAELDLQLRDFEDISGIHEVSSGTAPTGVKSGIAIAFLGEQDETKFGPIIHNIETTYENWAKFVLVLMQKYYIEPRMIKIVGKNGQVNVKEFQGSDLKGNKDVKVVSGSAMPKSTVARQNFVLDLWDRKILSDPPYNILGFTLIFSCFHRIPNLPKKLITDKIRIECIIQRN
ncbi:portal protein [Desulfitobacterium metallireducens]|uniref:Uncharacterized protein n=1 Tax=Desulfitobacterium metallireducens DSM 15288 TaxID=871968 RepID=W0ECF9_9FIRM|nr:hypothetical protein [Desulfitobacterium metallireducens]AHF08570.1 hypothetical protein DESME_08930 [Desulfitobacterium metallireducens DSM 15288]